MVRQYQINGLGRIGRDTCLVELLPLPSPSTGRWLYAQVADLPFLLDRETYREAMLPGRIQHLRLRIRDHRPPVVIFYSFSYRQHWEAIAGREFTWYPDLVIYSARIEDTWFLVTKHPAARGVDHEYFHKVGQYIAKTDRVKILR